MINGMTPTGTWALQTGHRVRGLCSADFLVGVDDFKSGPDAHGDVGATIRGTASADPRYPLISQKQQTESETQAEPARRRRGGLLIEPAGRTLVFGTPARSTGGGGPTDTDSAALIGCDASASLRHCVSALKCDVFMCDVAMSAMLCDPCAFAVKLRPSAVRENRPRRGTRDHL